MDFRFPFDAHCMSIECPLNVSWIFAGSSLMRQGDGEVEGEVKEEAGRERGRGGEKEKGERARRIFNAMSST